MESEIITRNKLGKNPMYQKLSGLYQGLINKPLEKKIKRIELELRIDADGNRPLNVVSGDFNSNYCGNKEYLSSFIFQTVKKIESPNEIILICDNGKFSLESEKLKNFQVKIPIKSYPPKAYAQWTSSSGSKLRCWCRFKSEYFRTIYLEHDYEEGVVPLESYDTATLCCPNSCRSRLISLLDAYAEAGIEIIVTKEEKDSVPSPKGTHEDGAVWTDRELYCAMREYFTAFKDEPQWKLWLLSANEYELSNINGIMTDRKEMKRRGCAVFQSATGWQSFEEKRMRLFIYVHELGHCFNLHHTWDRQHSNPSVKKSRYATLSWMNLPWRYYLSEATHGEDAFWKAFEFQFSLSELMHLRHGFRNNVIFGGNSLEKFTNEEAAMKRKALLSNRS